MKQKTDPSRVQPADFYRAVPARFEWTLWRNGYQWLDIGSKRLLCTVDALRPDRRDLLGRYETTYWPLAQYPRLFAEFAHLRPTENAILKFANQYGLLAASETVCAESNGRPINVHGDLLTSWRDEIGTLAVAHLLWQTLNSGKPVALGTFKKIMVAWPLAVQKRLRALGDDDTSIARAALRGLIDQRMRAHVGVEFRFRGIDNRLGLSIKPDSLLGAIWLQFANVVAEARQTGEGGIQ